MSFKKVIVTVVMAVAIFMSITLIGFADINVEVTETNVEICVDFSQEMSGKKVAVVIFDPSKDFSDITSYDNAALMNVFDYVKQTAVDATGKIKVNYAPSGKSGWYTVKIGNEEGETLESKRFRFVKQSDIDELLAELMTGTDISILRNLFASPEEDSLAGYEVLGLDTTEAYSVFSQTTNTVKESIYKSMMPKLQNISNLDSFKQIFSQAVYSERLFSINKVNELKEYIEEYADELGFSESVIYNKIYLSNVLCDRNVIKPKVLERITQVEWTDDRKANSVEVCENIIFLATIYHTNVYDRLGEIIEVAEVMLTENGANLEDLEDVSSKSNVYRYISGTNYENIDAFVSKLNEGIEKYSKGSSSGGSSNGGGGTKTGAKVQIPVMTDMVTSPKTLTSRFADLENVEWAVEAIEYLAQKGIISGKAENAFMPEEQMTREEFTKVLVLAFEFFDAAATVDFADVEKSAWYYQYVASANQKGIMQGYGDSFGTGDFITRQDLATTVCRALETAGERIESIREYKSFEDEDYISDYALESVKKLYSAGIINGMDENSFEPYGYATRAQVAKIIHGIFARKEG